MGFDQSQQQHLTAAEGFLELDMPLDADAELDRVDPYCRHQPEVLQIRVRIYRRLEKWELMQVAAKRLADYDPDNVQWTVWWAFATRRAISIASAKTILLNAVEHHPGVALFHYNLACYDCVLGLMEVAKARLQHACKLEPKLRMTALDDDDLKALWASL